MAGETGGTTDRTLNKLQYAVANKAADITTATTSDRFLIADVSDDYEVKWGDGANVLEAAGVTSSAAELNILDGVTATAAEINAAADVSGRLVSVPDGAAYTVLAANSGKPHVIAEQASNVTLTLPAVASGLEYEFYMGGFATEAQNWIFDTGSATNFYLGGLAFVDIDAGAGADEAHAGVYPDGNSNDIMTIVTPAAGTRIKLICDGTNWIVNGQVFSATVPTFAD